ncbi:hypothetical protein PUN28_013784 [Cardiocondyla obscurior]|uniref:Secreted protein n=1 Tax=Cardiocondyla obscurior TaxID=286306 RepID=A0AAW2F5J1_9HYME
MGSSAVIFPLAAPCVRACVRTCAAVAAQITIPASSTHRLQNRALYKCYRNYIFWNARGNKSVM